MTSTACNGWRLARTDGRWDEVVFQGSVEEAAAHPFASAATPVRSAVCYIRWRCAGPSQHVQTLCALEMLVSVTTRRVSSVAHVCRCMCSSATCRSRSSCTCQSASPLAGVWVMQKLASALCNALQVGCATVPVFMRSTAINSGRLRKHLCLQVRWTIFHHRCSGLRSPQRNALHRLWPLMVHRAVEPACVLRQVAALVGDADQQGLVSRTLDLDRGHVWHRVPAMCHVICRAGLGR